MKCHQHKTMDTETLGIISRHCSV